MYNNTIPSRDMDEDVKDLPDMVLEHSKDPYEQFKWFSNNNLSRKQSVMGMVEWTQKYFRSVSKTKVELTYSEIDNLMRGFYFALNHMQKDVPDHMYNYIQEKTHEVLDNIVQQKYNKEN